jgi:hypothetical protein
MEGEGRGVMEGEGKGDVKVVKGEAEKGNGYRNEAREVSRSVVMRKEEDGESLRGGVTAELGEGAGEGAGEAMPGCVLEARITGEEAAMDGVEEAMDGVEEAMDGVEEAMDMLAGTVLENSSTSAEILVSMVMTVSTRGFPAGWVKVMVPENPSITRTATI